MGKSVHSRSMFGTGRTAATFMTAIKNGLMEWPYSGVKSPKDVKVEHLMGCAKCHLPQLADAEDDGGPGDRPTSMEWSGDEEKDEAAEREGDRRSSSSLNINCLVCHHRNAITHKWVDGYPAEGRGLRLQGRRSRRPEVPEHEEEPAHLSESILCGQCHGLGPNFELENPTQCGTFYGSYLWAYIAEGGQETCQECHMKKSKLGHNMQSYRDPAAWPRRRWTSRSRNGIPLARQHASMMPKAVVKVEMINRAGHSIPDG